MLSQLHTTYYGPSWHGPTLRELLADVTAVEAVQHAIADVHSIWEIVLHTAAWKRVVIVRLEGTPVSLQGEADWPRVPNAGAAAWQDARQQLEEANAALLARVAQLSDADLDSPVPGQNVSVYATLHGVIQHDVYHAGQIALLKKTLRGARP
jgi:uncharacterized damage-inducible protein DinB